MTRIDNLENEIKELKGKPKAKAKSKVEKYIIFI